MQYVKLGDTGPQVSEICLGTMTWGSQMRDEKRAHAMLDRFVAAGGTFIDTAEMYPVPPKDEYVGSTEGIVGRWLQGGGEGRRESVVIATKVCGPSGRPFVVKKRVDPPLADSALPNLTRKDIHDACQGSLRRLQTTYIDILYVHWPSRPTPVFGMSLYTSDMEKRHPLCAPDLPYTTVEFEESILAMKELMDAGTIRHWAISNETSFGVCSIAAECKRLGVAKPVCIQNDFSLCDRRFCTELAESCAPWNHNISGVPYGILNGGALSDKYLKDTKPAGARHVWNPDFQPRYNNPRAMAACAKYAKVAKAAGLSTAVLAMAWAKQCFFNQSVIIGSNSIEQLDECLSISGVTLSKETLEAVDKIHFEDKSPNILVN